MAEIDPELRDKIVETHTDMKWVRETLEKGDATFKQHDKRIKHIEQWFVPILAAMSLAAHEILKLLGR